MQRPHDLAWSLLRCSWAFLYSEFHSLCVTGGGKSAPVLKGRAAYCCLMKLVLGVNLLGAVGWKPGTLGALWGR